MLKIRVVSHVDEIHGEETYSTIFIDPNFVSQFGVLNCSGHLYIVVDGIEHYAEYDEQVYNELKRCTLSRSRFNKIIKSSLWN